MEGLNPDDISENKAAKDNMVRRIRRPGNWITCVTLARQKTNWTDEIGGKRPS